MCISANHVMSKQSFWNGRFKPLIALLKEGWPDRGNWTVGAYKSQTFKTNQHKKMCVFSRFWTDRPSVQKPGLWLHCVCTVRDDAHHRTRGRCVSLTNAFCLFVYFIIVCCEPFVWHMALWTPRRTVSQCDPALPWRTWQLACTRTEPSWPPCCRDTRRAEGSTSTVICCPHRWVRYIKSDRLKERILKWICLEK